MVLNDGLQKIGNHAFATSALESVKIPGTVRRLEQDAFYGVSKLKQVQLAEGLEEIGASCFQC